MFSTRSIIVASALSIATLISTPAFSVPISITNEGWWLETLGNNTIGIGGGGASGGLTTSLFVANTSPPASGGTTASANFSGTPTGSPGVVAGDPTELWAYRALSPDSTRLSPITVNFQNGADAASFTGRDLRGLSPLSLAQDLSVDASVEPFSPLITWSLPNDSFDLIQIAFYSDATNGEVGSRAVLPKTATSYDIVGSLPGSFALVVNVRLVDLFDENAPFTDSNILRMSRAYVNYVSPPLVAAIPEPETYALMFAGLALVGAFARRAKKAGD